MHTDLSTLEDLIQQHRVHLDSWLDGRYKVPHQQREYGGEHDGCYENWGNVESTVGAIFDARLTQFLSSTALDSLLFFASRNEECGRIISWLGRAGPLSGVGDLTLSDFIFLCDAALARPEDYVDYELANCFHKLPSLNQQHIDILLGFFARRYAYTKRVAIDVLAKKGFPDISKLAQQLWDHDDCEWTKLSALYALKQSQSAPSLFAGYLAEFKALYDIDAHEYLQSHMRQLEC